MCVCVCVRTADAVGVPVFGAEGISCTCELPSRFVQCETGWTILFDGRRTFVIAASRWAEMYALAQTQSRPMKITNASSRAAHR